MAKKQILNVMSKEDKIIIKRTSIEMLYINKNKLSLERQKLCLKMLSKIIDLDNIQKEKGLGNVYGIEMTLEEVERLFGKLSSIPEYNFIIPAEYYRKLYHNLEPFEREQIKKKIPEKSCQNCDIFSCEGKDLKNKNHFCDNWINKEEIGKQQVLELIKKNHKK